MKCTSRIFALNCLKRQLRLSPKLTLPEKVGCMYFNMFVLREGSRFLEACALMGSSTFVVRGRRNCWNFSQLPVWQSNNSSWKLFWKILMLEEVSRLSQVWKTLCALWWMCPWQNNCISSAFGVLVKHLDIIFVN